MRRVRGALLALALAVSLAAVGTLFASSHATTRARATTSALPLPTERAAAAARWSIVGLGDSVTAATACGCQGFISLYGAQLHAQTHVATVTHNLGVPGQTSAGLLAQLLGDPGARSAVADGDIVVVTVGANDFDFAADSCANAACYSSALTALRSNMTKILSAIQRLRRHHSTLVLVTDYWEVWKDGAVGRSLGTQYMTVGDTLTHRVNSVIEQASAGAGARLVDLYVPFHGAQGTDDDTTLLAPDGDHPSAAGHAVIASALIQAGTMPLG
jgi:lysophospholipase L1-like esterase